VDPYRPDQWHDFFFMVGGGAAALTGLVVVAMSLHLDAIAGDPVLRHRARSILTGLTAVFMRCALVLMGGQGARAVAVELFVVCAVITAAGVASYRQVARGAERVPRASAYRTAGSITCYIVEMAGAAVLFAGSSRGLYVVAVAMVANFFFMISGSWLLLVGIGREETLTQAAGSERR
jgi:hypothetical protein